MIEIKRFELNIPTHIKFTLYKYDYIDRIIISRVLSECEKSNSIDDLITVRSIDFINAFKSSKVLKSEINKIQDIGWKNINDLLPNSVHFIWTILEKLKNLEFISFKISYDKEFSRIYKYNNKHIHNFDYKILYGVFDLNKILNKDEIDEFNMLAIDFGLMENNYLMRKSYFRIRASILFEMIEILETEGKLRTFNILNFDEKLEIDNPFLLIKTDYSVY